MYFMGFGFLCGRYNHWVYSLGSVENRLGHESAFDGARGLTLMLLNNIHAEISNFAIIYGKLNRNQE